MGNWSSQFVSALRNGDVDKASELYLSKAQLRSGLQPNQALGPDDNTYLHHAARLGMAQMYQDLIVLKGKPDMKNAQRRNCIHLICLQPSAEGHSAEGHSAGGHHSAGGQVKREMLEYTLKEGLEGMDLRHLLAEKDEDGNTALHLAAGAGLMGCVELLLSNGADLGATNENGQTPADLAKARGHDHIATSLEAKMVFSCEEDMVESVEPDSDLLEEIVEAPVAMQDTDLRSMKDALLIEASQILGVSLQSAEVLLKHYGWSKEELLQAWLEDSAAVCAVTGIEMPEDDTAVEDFLGVTTPPAAEGGMPDAEEMLAAECGVCYGTCEQLPVPCGHHFCKECWKEYLEEKIRMGETQNISCPQYACYKLVPLEVIEGVVSHQMAAKFLSFDIKAFVDSNPNIRWCPHPGCSQAVSRLPPSDDHTHSSPTHLSGEVKGQTVVCGNGHYFCWSCLGEAHEPCSCAQWKRWLEHCNGMRSRIGETTAAEADEAASSKWLVDNSKPCPKCRSPIQKTEGCNHMCCKYCRHDFCWVCLEEWKCHNSSTGGYFNCNRYDAQLKARQSLTQRRLHVLKDCKEWEEVSKFLHYHERYKEHIKSYELEEPFLDKAQQKMIELALSIQHLESESASTHHASIPGGNRPLDFTFIQDAVQELLKCRQVLKATYCYGYYLTGIVSKKQFEHMQGALEQVTEMLAEAVARPHLRKPRLEIIRLTREGRVKRVCLVKNVHTGLPLSSHPFMDSLQGFGGHSWGKDNPQMRRFLRDLDTYTPAQETAGLTAGGKLRHRYQPDTDDDLLRILEESRLEHEADKRMQTDLELAKTLSLKDTPQAPPTGLGDSWLDELALSSSHGANDHTPSWPVLKLASPLATQTWPPAAPLSPPPSNFSDVQSPRQGDLHNSDLRVRSTLPANDKNWGPLYGEDEDLFIAIRDSVNDTSASHNTAAADNELSGGVTVGGSHDSGTWLGSHDTAAADNELSGAWLGVAVGGSHDTADNELWLDTATADNEFSSAWLDVAAGDTGTNIGLQDWLHPSSNTPELHPSSDPPDGDCMYGAGHYNNASHVTDGRYGDGDHVTSHHRKGVLVTGYQTGPKPSSTSPHQMVGHDPHGRSSMLHFSGPQILGESVVPSSPAAEPSTQPSSSAEERGQLPPQLQHLLDSSQRLGTNV